MEYCEGGDLFKTMLMHGGALEEQWVCAEVPARERPGRRKRTQGRARAAWCGGGRVLRGAAVRKKIRIRPTRAPQVIAPLLRILEKMHALKLLHRDIKPENIFLTALGKFKLVRGRGRRGGRGASKGRMGRAASRRASCWTRVCAYPPPPPPPQGDFGLAIKFDEEVPFSRSGTLDYMAPEARPLRARARAPPSCAPRQAPRTRSPPRPSRPSPTPPPARAQVLKNPSVPFQEGRSVDPAMLAARGVSPYGPPVDVWAAGVLAYELITGHPPFEVEDEAQTAALIMYSDNVKFPAAKCAGGGGGRSEAVPSSLGSTRAGALRACPSLPLTPPTWTDPARTPQWADFVRAALVKNPDGRPSAAQLLAHPWVQLNMQRASAGGHRPSKDLLLQPLPLAPGGASGAAAGGRTAGKRTASFGGSSSSSSAAAAAAAAAEQPAPAAAAAAAAAAAPKKLPQAQRSAAGRAAAARPLPRDAHGARGAGGEPPQGARARGARPRQRERDGRAAFPDGCGERQRGAQRERHACVRPAQPAAGRGRPPQPLFGARARVWPGQQKRRPAASRG